MITILCLSFEEMTYIMCTCSTVVVACLTYSTKKTSFLQTAKAVQTVRSRPKRKWEGLTALTEKSKVLVSHHQEREWSKHLFWAVSTSELTTFQSMLLYVKSNNDMEGDICLKGRGFECSKNILWSNKIILLSVGKRKKQQKENHYMRVEMFGVRDDNLRCLNSS